jgi:hypothetical protein
VDNPPVFRVDHVFLAPTTFTAIGALVLVLAARQSARAKG